MPLHLRHIVMLLTLLAFRRMSEAQDLHFSQFHAAAHLTSPAAALTFEGDQRYAAQTRSQWLSVPVPYQTVTATFAQKWGKPQQAGRWAWGGALLYDEAGDAQLTQLAVQLYGGYRRRINDQNTVTLGGSWQAGQRRFEASALTFDAQYLDGTFQPQAITGEDFQQFAHTYMDLGLGGSWTTALTERLRFTLGVGAWHLNRPDFSFFETSEARLPLKTLLYLDGVIPLGDRLDLLPSAMYALQGASYERVFGTYVRYLLEPKAAQRRALLLGTWYRFNDAVMAAVAVEYNYWRVGLSYDINTSAFAVATAGQGALELSIEYRLFKVWPLAPVPDCGVF